MTTLLLSPKHESLEWCDRELPPELRPVERAEDAAAALDALSRTHFERVLIDLGPDPEAGLAALPRVRAARPDLPVVALVEQLDSALAIQAFRGGAGDVASLADDAVALSRAFERAGGAGEAVGQARTTALFAASGGLGATSLAVNLSERMASLGASEPLLVDLDLYLGSARSFLPELETAGPHELLSERSRLDGELLHSLVPNTEAGFRLISGTGEVQDAEAVRGGEIRELFQLLGRHAGELVLDLPHDFSTATLAALDACDRLLLVVSQDPPALRRAQAALDFCAELGVGADRSVAVIQRFDRRADLRAEDVARVLGVEVAACIPRDDAFASAARERAPLAAVAPAAPSSRAIEALARTLLDLPAPDAPWWSRWFGSRGETP